MDSIDIHPEHFAINNAGGYIFTIVQKSIRFAKLKKLAVYSEHDYMGTYEVLEAHCFPVKSLSNMVSLLIFGDHQKYGIETLKEFRIRGRMSDNTEMCFICLRFISYDEKFKINRVNNEKPSEQQANRKAVRDESGQAVSDAESDDLGVAPF
jgi:hypothetical protein